MAITTIDGLVAALTGTVRHHCIMKTFTPAATGAQTSLWTMAGQPGAAATPSAGINGEIPTDATAGAFPFTNPAGGSDTYLSELGAFSTTAGTLILFDRLWHNNFPNATTTTAQAISPSALTRPDANGAGVEAWFAVYAATGAGAPTPTIVYTDQDGNTGQAGTVVGYAASTAAGRNYPIQLAAGDTGVRAITSFTSSVSMTSGTIGLVLRRRIAEVSVSSGSIGQVLRFLELGGPQVYDDACLELMWQASGSSATVVYGSLRLIQG